MVPGLKKNTDVIDRVADPAEFIYWCYCTSWSGPLSLTQKIINVPQRGRSDNKLSLASQGKSWRWQTSATDRLSYWYQISQWVGSHGAANELRLWRSGRGSCLREDRCKSDLYGPGKKGNAAASASNRPLKKAKLWARQRLQHRPLSKNQLFQTVDKRFTMNC